MPADSSRAVFLSYASQDADAAKRICDALRAASVEVWLDQSELRGGDAWDQKIRRQIKECALFVPLISANTNARPEGYFRLEWHLAEQRTYLMAHDQPFLVPVVVDDSTDDGARVPERFHERQWTRLPAGETTPAFAARIKKLVSGENGPTAVATLIKYPANVASTRIFTRRTAIYVVAALAVLIATGYAVLRSRQSPRNLLAPVATKTDSAITSPSPARQLANRAAAIVDDPSDKNSTNLGAAAALCERAEALDPTDGEIWAIEARIDTLLYWLQFDPSEERRQRAQQAAAKAVALAPGSRSARRAQGLVFAAVVRTAESVAAGESIYRQLLQEAPADGRLLSEWASILFYQGRVDEAVATFERAGSLIEAGWALFATGRFEAADKIANRILAHGTDVGGLYLKAHVQLFGFEDLVAAQQTLVKLPASESQTENGASIALMLGYCRRDSEQMLRAMTAFPQEFLTKQGFPGPKRMWTGVAYDLGGHQDAARTEWSVALHQVTERRKDRPGDLQLLLAEAWLRAHLDQREDAEKALRLYLQLTALEPTDEMSLFSHWTLLRLGKNDEALTQLTDVLRGRRSGFASFHAIARFCGMFDPLRADPRFGKLLRETLPQGARPLDNAWSGPADKLKPEGKP